MHERSTAASESSRVSACSSSEARGRFGRSTASAASSSAAAAAASALAVESTDEPAAAAAAAAASGVVSSSPPPSSNGSSRARLSAAGAPFLEELPLLEPPSVGFISGDAIGEDANPRSVPAASLVLRVRRIAM